MAPTEPKNVTCEWCDKPSVVAAEIRKGRKKVPAGQFIYACGQHAQKAYHMAGVPEISL